MTKTVAEPRVHLPKPIAVYLAADGDDSEVFSRCFAEDAIVRDEGQTYRGLAAIKQWKAETARKYRHTIEPLASVVRDGNIVVTNRLTGNFPGSPIELEFIFRIEDDRIASLEIRG